MGKKYRCKACERRRLEEQERKMMDSWLCFFFEDVWCRHSGVPKDKRINGVCAGCGHFEEFLREMEEEEARDAEFFEAVEKDPEAYFRGEI